LGLFLSHNAFDNVCASLFRVLVDEQCPCAPPAYIHPSIPILNTHTHRIKRTHIKRKHAADVRLVMCDMYEIAEKGCWGTECWSNSRVSKRYLRVSSESKKVQSRALEIDLRRVEANLSTDEEGNLSNKYMQKEILHTNRKHCAMIHSRIK